MPHWRYIYAMRRPFGCKVSYFRGKLERRVALWFNRPFSSAYFSADQPRHLLPRSSPSKYCSCVLTGPLQGFVLHAQPTDVHALARAASWDRSSAMLHRNFYTVSSHTALVGPASRAPHKWSRFGPERLHRKVCAFCCESIALHITSSPHTGCNSGRSSGAMVRPRCLKTSDCTYAHGGFKMTIYPCCRLFPVRRRLMACPTSNWSWSGMVAPV